MDYEASVNELIDGAAKPPNSLGLLEKYFRKMLLAWETIHTEVRPHHLIFAADNGVVEEGVVAFPPVITYLQAQNMVDGRATISCFCQSNAIPYTVVDVGINNAKAVGVDRKIAFGSKNFMKEEAMSVAEFQQAWQAGKELVEQVVMQQGGNLLSFGEMGIGNTTTSSAVLHALTGMFPEFLVGYGASPVNNEVLKRKRMVVSKGVERHKAAMHSVEDMIRCVGGFDIAAICAGMLECARLKTPFVIDGFITAVAYACAAKINGDIEKYAIPSHMSKEPGMAYALLLGNILADDVIIRGSMALGEGTGAVLMVSMMKSMSYAMFHMARLTDFDLSAAAPPVAM
ncbi:nicotinate-nucleotide--dimethylbenzimidazole phosphoribosyltransferase [bacterium BFN5]|nr:nicotinate-nucleotide--dimethylbenzimidazole phosphoribosyltransferase [bacterium BFN5]QJW48206.1 nicotinate-nucleotide--dimethylbenzimidazole phosphoribosyltransferase [bacterium BFN5]